VGLGEDLEAMMEFLVRWKRTASLLIAVAVISLLAWVVRHVVGEDRFVPCLLGLGFAIWLGGAIWDDVRARS
jgi:hypothetical protein